MFMLVLFIFLHLSLQLMSGSIEGQAALKANAQPTFFIEIISMKLLYMKVKRNSQKFLSPQTTRQI